MNLIEVYAIRAHAIKKLTPPMGVIAPNKDMPLRLNAYKLPEKSTTPASINQPEASNKRDVFCGGIKPIKVRPIACHIW